MKTKILVLLLLTATFYSANIYAQDKSAGDEVFMVVEEMPVFPGGDAALRKFISSSLKYPEIAKEKGIQGKVYASFVISKEGNVIDTKIERGVDPSLDKEALRVLSGLPQWKPGKQRGQTVNVKFTVPINFELGDDAKFQSEQTTSDGEPLFFIVEEMPEFTGGEEALREFIANNIKYPHVAKDKGIQGKVFVSFTVSKDGKVKDAKVERGVDPSLDKEALRVINTLPLWKPGKQRGEAVNVRYTVPIVFKLN